MTIPQTVLTSLRDVCTSLHDKLRYTHANSSLRETVVKLQAQIDKQVAAAKKQTEEHQQALAALDSWMKERIKEKERKWYDSYKKEVGKKEELWKEKEVADAIEIKALLKKVDDLNKDKKRLDR
jgi:hypothetical protein